jgi:hypothetical protein
MFKFIPKNVGGLDQILRLGICSGMVYAGFINEELIQDKFSSILLGIIGVVLMLTVVFRFCPLYMLIGWSTCRDGSPNCEGFDTNNND